MSAFPGIEEPPRKSYSESVLSKLLIPGGSFLVATISLLNTKDLPTWALIVLVGFVGIIAIAILAPAVTWAFSRLRFSLQLRRVAKRLYPQLDRILQRLQDQLTQNMSDTLVYELRDFMSVPDGKGNMVLADLNQSISLSEWLNLTRGRLARRRVQEFIDTAQSIDLAVKHYNQFCRMIENRLNVVMSERMLDDSVLRKLKRIWNHGREGQVRLMQEWAAIGQDINHELDTRICSEYFSPIKNLE